MANSLQKINALEVSYARSWAGLTTENHLYAIFQNEPQLASSIVTKVFSMNRYQGLDAFLSKYPAKEMPHDGEYEWMLKGDDRKAINILSYTAADVNRPGISNSIFRIELQENFFEQSDKLIFDTRDFSVRLMSNGVATGTGWLYECQIMKPGGLDFIPPSLLTAGKKVSKVYSPESRTLNKEYGGIQFTSPFKMRNIFSTIGKHYEVPGNMHDRKMLITMTDPSGKQTTVWTRYQEMVCDWQWEHEKANNLMFSEFNQEQNGTFATKGSGGYPIFEGAGLRQQISPSYKFFYTTFTIDYLFEILLSLSINILPEDDREFLLLTGERGMIQFHQAVEDKVALILPLGVENRVTGSGQNLGVQGQYRQYMFPQGIKVTVMNLPQYNDPIDNRTPHPDGGYTENYRYTIMNIGTSGGEPNIQKVYPVGRRDMSWYVCGGTTPFGPQHNNGMGASAVDGYEKYYYTTQGIMLRNPLSCAELIYAAV